MSDRSTTKIEPIKRTYTRETLATDLRRALIETEHVGCDIADAVARLIERINALERMAA